MKYSLKTAAFIFLIFLSYCCLPVWKANAQSAVTEQYIQQYKGIAEEEMQRTGVPAAISLAQGIIESQSGTGWLVKHSRNHFGIKCKAGWTGRTIRYDDDHKNECFRVYDTDDSSWRDHSDFLKNTPRYAFLFYLKPLDYKAWAYGLKKAGYATNKRYAKQLIGTIEKYHLQQYSKQAFAAMQNRPDHDFAAMLDKKIDLDRRQTGTEPPAPETTAGDETSSSPYPAGLFRINHCRVLYLPEGAQLIPVAEKYHIRLSRLLRYNELEHDVLPKSMLVYLQKKRKTGVHRTYTAAGGETLHEIAQKEGIRLKWLCRRNGIGEDVIPAAGSLLYLSGYAPETAKGKALASKTSASSRKGFWYKLSHLFSGHKDETAPSRIDTGGTAAQDAGVARKRPVREIKTAAPERYEVRPGDTLYSISKRYGVTVSQLKAWNRLQDDTIRTGQQLIVHHK